MTTNKKIDISAPLETFIKGILIAIVMWSLQHTSLLSFLEVDHHYTRVVEANVISSYVLEQQSKMLIEAHYIHDETNYVIYVFDTLNAPLTERIIIYEIDNNPKRCEYEGKEYVAQSITGKIR